MLITVDKLTKSFTSRPLFANLTFTINEGDHIGLVGPNGSGKSTLLKILAGMDEPDSGTRSVRKRLRVGYVPQDPVFAPGKTVEDVLEEALGEHDPARIALTLGKAGFDDRSMATETLSGGWRIVKTMGTKIVKLQPVGGFCAETAGAITLFGATAAGIPVSTTHTITGSIVGVGSAKRFSAVKWGVAGRIVWAWVLTIPMAALIAALSYGVILVIEKLTGRI